MLVVVLLIFGTGKLRNVGRDLGNAIAGFRKGPREGESATAAIPHGQHDDDAKPPR